MDVLKNLDWSPLYVSFKTGAAATFVCFFLGIFAAERVMRLPTGRRAFVDGILTMPLILPPTAAGFFLLLLFSRRRPLGSFLFQNFVLSTWTFKKYCTLFLKSV